MGRRILDQAIRRDPCCGSDAGIAESVRFNPIVAETFRVRHRGRRSCWIAGNTLDGQCRLLDVLRGNDDFLEW